MPLTLRQYQIDGINAIKDKKSFGIFWQQRLGKTIVAIKAIEDYNKVIIAVPYNCTWQWYDEIVNNTNIKHVYKLPRQKEKRLNLYNKFKVDEKIWIVGSYDTISQDFISNGINTTNFDYLVIDEAHFLRNCKSQRTKGINKLRLRANYALALSGTPAVNSPIDLLRILKFLHPECNFNQTYLYKKKYFNAIKVNNRKSWEIKPNMVEEWKNFLATMCDIKKVYDYLKWLPQIIEKTITLDMDSIQRKHYNDMLIESKRILINSKKKEKFESKAITQIIRLQQICLDPKILNIESPSAKIDWLNKYLNEFLEEDDQEFIIVFTNFSSVYDVWNIQLDKKFNYAYLTGKVNDNDRKQIIKDFQEGKIRVLFTNIKLASLGLTLDKATCTIFLDKSWNPVNNEQAMFRMVDTKQKEYNKPKLNINLICANSIDDKINEVLSNKKTNTNIIYELEQYLIGENESFKK